MTKNVRRSTTATVAAALLCSGPAMAVEAAPPSWARVQLDIYEVGTHALRSPGVDYFKSIQDCIDRPRKQQKTAGLYGVCDLVHGVAGMGK